MAQVILLYQKIFPTAWLYCFTVKGREERISSRFRIAVKPSKACVTNFGLPKKIFATLQPILVLFVLS